MTTVKITKIHKSQVTNGDVIIVNGVYKTVSNSNIKRDELLGVTIFGDCFGLTKGIVERVQFKQYYRGVELADCN